ncbi:MAG: glycoside hydrolase family 30 protein [Bacillota bacterium]
MIKHFESSKQSDKYHKLVNKSTDNTGTPLVYDKHKTYQTVLGFGGAFTEAAAYTFYQMTPKQQEEVLHAYFNKETGLGYTLGRVSIHSCDFGLGNYTYLNDGDDTLESFSIARDQHYVIPMIKRAAKIANDPLHILASPWSPPAWMKTNNDMNHGGKLLPKYYQTWAEYYVKFLDAYKSSGVNVDMLSVQNEPAAKQVWDSCVYTAEEERDFVKHYLGPTLKKSIHKDVKLLIWDHNRDIIVDRARTVLEDQDASKYVWGTGFHWYMSEAFENLETVHNLFPNKHLLFTEGTIEGGVALGEFRTAARYARNMIGDFSHYNEGHIDWNLLLNEQGGPNHVGNYCDAPIIFDRKTQTVHYNPSFYAIKHFSAHVQPGAKRIASTLSSDRLKHVAFVNPDDSIAIVIQNESDTDATITIDNTHLTITAQSISTLILRGEA